MALISMSSLLREAQANRYAVCFFEAWNLESLLAVVDAAEQSHSPIIIGFCGDYLSHLNRLDLIPLEYLAALGRTACNLSSVPMSLILNETSDYSLVQKGMQLGFNAVLYDNPELTWPEKIARTKALVETAHVLGVTVEAEVGELPDAVRRQDGKMSKGEKTDPTLIESFVRETGVDAVAVAIGNVHTLLEGEARLDFDLLSEIRRCTKVPLVLHGGTGVNADDLKRACREGISKVNVGAVFKQAFYEAVKGQIQDASQVSVTDPHAFFGCGSPHDLMTAGRLAMCKKALELLKISGSVGKALVGKWGGSDD